MPTVAEDSPFEPEVLVWPVYRALDDAQFVAAHPRLHAYLDGADELLRYELACRVAALLRDYSTYREDWLEAWAAGRLIGLGDADERWQAELYGRVSADLHVDTRHPAPPSSRRCGRPARRGHARPDCRRRCTCLRCRRSRRSTSTC